MTTQLGRSYLPSFIHRISKEVFPMEETFFRQFNPFASRSAIGTGFLMP